MLTRYTHTNVIARDWRRLAQFYVQVFGCTPLGPERDLSGEWLERATGIPGAHLRGQHLRLPGSEQTLEVFTYDEVAERPVPGTNATGFGHVAFHVDDVSAKLARVIEEGGSAIGEVVETDVPEVGKLTFVYARDPEGNVLELQRWG